ncbi:HlyD family secretion protein [Propionispora hippei]|uniref:Membrane fusion protein, multidrug efflux system n=1 Tax=Propionispora hippei DSM 15287 TaxID=1123003 RepID=A0A1M6JD57_9FIRM|nr:HlyD family secretion protein [Propionispora hippei]SHJ44665.1 membrane fusion protein, multidrug efflux system [Propionispora hippei DSM 15287]
MGQATNRLSKRTMGMIVGLIVLIAVSGGVWWWIRSSRIVSTDDARVKGTIVNISAKVTGRVEKLLVQEGDAVTAGQVVATIEQREFQAQLEQAQAALAAAQAKLALAEAGNRPQEIAEAGASVTQAQATLENARKEYERVEALYRQGGISAQQRDAAKTAWEVAKAQCEAAQNSYSVTNEGSRPEDIKMLQAQVQQAQAAVKSAQVQLDDTVIKAPVSGTLALKSVEDGEVVSAGQPLVSIANLSDVWIAANIEETYIGKVKAGQEVSFTIDAYPGKTFTGKVKEVGPAAGSQFALLPNENTSGNFTKVTQRLPIKIQAENAADGELKPGMSAIIEIHVR